MQSLCLPFQTALATASTATSFAALIPTATEPSGAGVFDLASESLGLGGNTYVPSHLQLLPFGTNGNNDTFDFRLYGWSKVAGSTLYIPQLLIDVSVILGNIDGSAIGTNVFLADTLTVNDGPADSSIWRSLIDCQEDLPASVVVHTRGCRWIQFDWDLAGGQEAASMNCYWRPITP